MNYYPFHLGDYASHTGHLEPMEDLAYRRMLDAYYLRETPLPSPVPDVARLIRMRQNVTEVEAVLNEFFLLTSEGWRHTRCDEEIAKMQDKQAASSEKVTHERDRMRRHRERRSEMFDALRNVGITPAWDISIKDLQQLYNANCNAPETHLKREQAVSSNAPATAIPTPTPTPTPTPVINTPIPPAPQAPGAERDVVSAAFAAFWKTYPKKVGKDAAEKVWARKVKADDVQAVMDALDKQRSSEQWNQDGGRFIPHPSTWLNQGRWKDEELADEEPSRSKLFAGVL